MATPEEQEAFRKETEEMRKDAIDLAAMLYTQSCGSDRRTRRTAVELGELVGTTQELQEAVEKRTPHLKQLREIREELRKKVKP